MDSISSEVGTLKKGLDLLMLLINRPNLTVQEIMVALEFNKSTTYRLVSTLELNHFIDRNDNNRYQISDKFVHSLMSQSVRQSFDLNWLSVPPMMKLSKLTNESIDVSVLRGTEVVISQVVSGLYSTRTHQEVGYVNSVHYTAGGKCILAFQEEETLQRLVNAIKFEKKTDNTIVDPATFIEQLHQIRENGYSLDNEESEVGVRCIAAPIFRNGRAFAAVSLSGPSTRVTTEKDHFHIPAVRQCADEITQILTTPELLMN
ncbi:IclR family transcriptional regulator [Paenibacillus sp. CGMCC 1.18879]|uniref:IclR family transcriptional regulator n=1 Tax=Paenibacillus sp. CGMCC 1.18879 TaxID=2834466 RepID=UPI001F1E7C8F|nr:IclR family transcriptional regulator [Paenibacillus sp. CGMCC 1.18879]